MNPFEEYFKLEGILKRNRSLTDVFRNIIQRKKYDCINTTALQNDLEPNKSLGRYIWKFGEALREHAKTDEPLDIPGEFDENYMLAIFYITLCEEEIPHEESSSSIQVTNALISYANCKKDVVFLQNETFVLMIGISLGRLAQRYEQTLSIPTQLIYDLNDFIIKHNLTFKTLHIIVKYMIAFTVKDYTPLTDIIFYDFNTSCSKLAFVILSNIITKRYTVESIRQRLIQYIFTEMEEKCNKITMTESEREFIDNNYGSLMWQTAPNLLNMNPFIYAMATILQSYPAKKCYILLINKLPFKMYIQILKITYKLARQNYSHAKQALLYNILQTPCLTETVEHKMQQTDIIMKLVESVFWSMKLVDREARVNTIQLIDCVLRLNDPVTVGVVKNLLETHQFYSGFKILNFVYEHTNINWANDHKKVNQYFISIFCNVFILRGMQYENNFRQFKLLLEAADSADLVPCLPILLKLYKNFAKSFSMIRKPILTAFSFHAISPNSEFLEYLKTIHTLIFNLDDEIIMVPKSDMLDIILNDLEYEDLIWRKLISHNIISSYTVKNLFEGLLAGQDNIWRILSAILPNMPNEFLPLIVRDYWKCLVNKTNIWNHKEIVHILNCVGELVELKLYNKEHEKEFFMDVFRFLCSQMLHRSIDLIHIPQALVAAKKLMDSLKLEASHVSEVYKDIENCVEDYLSTFHPKREHEFSKYLLRDTLYYREMSLVFSENVQPRTGVVEFVTKILKNLEGFHNSNQEIICNILRIAVQLGIRYKELQELTNSTLKMLVPTADFHLKAAILYCYYDIAIMQSGNFNAMLPIVYDFFFSDIWELQFQAAKILMALINGNRYVPNAWELYVLLHLLGEENVFKFYGEDFIKMFFTKCEKCFEDSFTNIVLYFHKLYDQKNYELTNNQKNKIPRKDLTLQQRKFLYEIILNEFSTKTKLKIINELYIVVVDKFQTLPLEFPHNYELLQDIIYITHQGTRNESLFFPKNNETLYEQSMDDIKNLMEFTATKKDILQDEEDEKILKKIINGIMNFLDHMDKHVRVVFPELFHLVLCVFNWHYDKICNMLVDEGPGGSLRTVLKRIPIYFESYKPLLHMEIPINLEEPPTII